MFVKLMLGLVSTSLVLAISQNSFAAGMLVYISSSNKPIRRPVQTSSTIPQAQIDF